MSRRGGGRESDPRRDHPSPAASRGRGVAGRGRGAPSPANAPPQRPGPVTAPQQRPGPVASPASAQPQRPGPVAAPTSAPPQRPGPVAAPTSAHPQRPGPVAVPASAPPQRPGPVSAPASAPPQKAGPAASVPEAAKSTTAAASSSSAAVEAVSDDLKQMAVKASPDPASSKAVRYPVRPGFGKHGRKCVVRANHFLVKFVDCDICHYDVSINPEVTSKKVNRDVIEKLFSLYGDSHLGGKKPAYDGMKSMYSAGEFPFGSASKEFVIKLEEVGAKAGGSASTPKRERKDREFKVVLKLASKPDLQTLQQFLQGRQPVSPQETIQALDVVLRHKPSTIYTVVGRSLFHPDLGQMGELGSGTEFWKGFYQSLRPTQMGLSLNIDVSARAFYEPISVVQFAAKYLNLRDPSRPLTEHDRIRIKKALRGIKVETSHMSHKKTYKVSGISTEPINRLMFSLDDGRQISVYQYFRDKYKMALKYATWPAIQAGSAAKPAYLPMEICDIVGGQRYSKKLNEVQVRNLLRATCERPNVRESNIKNMVIKNKYNDEGVVKNFGIQVKAEMAEVEARVLPPPMLLYHGTGKTAMEKPNMGQWNMIDKKMVNGGAVDYWACVNFSRWNRDLEYQFCHDLVDMCSSKGMAFQREPVIPIYTANPQQIERTLVEVYETSKKACGDGKQLQLLIIILPDASGSYGTIKRICETELGIVSQCCQPRQAGKLNKQYLENLALKINVKVGGRNSVLNDAINRTLPLVTDAPTIIFGADVTHPQPGEDSSPSIAAVVASMDWPQISKYRGLVSAQPHREEIIRDLYTSVADPQKGLVHGGMIRELLMAFYKSTRQKPSRILFYRDGVSEGQFSQVLLHEMDAIRKGCMSLQAGYLPPVTFVVVQKRHHTRLFPTDRRDADRSGNIYPGTVVDTKICHPSEFDFYLNSHAGIQGTSRPTHYHVLFDENRFSADGLQILTNNLCYTYARCTRSVSIVPPAYYAHLAAFRARYYIEGDNSDAGSSSAGGAAGGPRNYRPLPVIKDNVKDVMFYC